MARLFTRLLTLKPATPIATSLFRPSVSFKNQFYINKKWAHNAPLTYDAARERIMLVLHLYDKIDPEKLTLNAHFINDLGLDSLDHTEIIMEMEDEFDFEIPDKDAENLLRPADILRYITDKEEAYEALQHHGHGHGHDDHSHDHKDAHDPKHHASAGHHSEHMSTNQTKRAFSSLSYIARRNFNSLMDDTEEERKKRKHPTTFDADRHDPPSLDNVMERVLKVLGQYDKIDTEKLHSGAHFVEELGLDSLDHVEILMQMEDEFNIEIPDQEGEKLMRPAALAKFIWHKEAAKCESHATPRPF